MFKAEYFIFKDEDGKPYHFRARRFFFLFYIAAFLWLLFFVGLICTLVLYFCVWVSISIFFDILFFALVLFVFSVLVLIIARSYSLTVEESKLIYENIDKLVVLDLSLTKMKCEGLTIILREGEKEEQIFYLSKEINDALVKFLGEVGISDNSQKEELS